MSDCCSLSIHLLELCSARLHTLLELHVELPDVSLGSFLLGDVLLQKW
jgi:hypothetical protein